MKYFTYQLFPIATGELIGPDRYLPEGSSTGVPSDTPYYFYGKADVTDLTIISDFQPVEVPESEYNFFSQLNVSGSAPVEISGSVDFGSTVVDWTLTK